MFNYVSKISENSALNKNNKTPLHYAAESDSIKIGELLITVGADINAKDNIYSINGHNCYGNQKR